MEEKHGTRRGERVTTAAPVQVTWKDRFGQEKFANARTLDVSSLGMRIEMPEPLERLAYVTFRSESLALQGTGSVRSCVRQGNKYVVGLEFSGGLKWKPKASPA